MLKIKITYIIRPVWKKAFKIEPNLKVEISKSNFIMKSKCLIVKNMKFRMSTALGNKFKILNIWKYMENTIDEAVMRNLSASYCK